MKLIYRGSYTSDHFIWNLLNEPLASLINLILNDHKYNIYCLSYDLLDLILSPSKFVYFDENLHCWNGRRHDITFSTKCYVTGSLNIIYDMTLSTEYQ